LSEWLRFPKLDHNLTYLYFRKGFSLWGNGDLRTTLPWVLRDDKLNSAAKYALVCPGAAEYWA